MWVLALITGVMTVIILYTYYYLVEISKCPCFVANKADELNLEYIKFYLLLDLFSMFLYFFLIFYLKVPVKGQKTKGGATVTASVLVLFAILLVSFIHGYMTYNVYHFYQSIKSYCECANQWQRYFVYYEGIVASLVTLQYVLSFLLVILFLITSKL